MKHAMAEHLKACSTVTSNKTDKRPQQRSFHLRYSDKRITYLDDEAHQPVDLGIIASLDADSARRDPLYLRHPGDEIRIFLFMERDVHDIAIFGIDLMVCIERLSDLSLILTHKLIMRTVDGRCRIDDFFGLHITELAMHAALDCIFEQRISADQNDRHAMMPCQMRIEPALSDFLPIQ